MKSVGETLKYLANRFNVAVVVINQMTTKFVEENNLMKPLLCPALGKAWSDIVDKRIQLCRGGKSLTVRVKADDSLQKKQIVAEIRKAAVEQPNRFDSEEAKNRAAEFIILPGGIRSLPAKASAQTKTEQQL